MRPIVFVTQSSEYCRTCNRGNVTHLAYVDDPHDDNSYVVFNLPCGHHDARFIPKNGVSMVLSSAELAMATLMMEET